MVHCLYSRQMIKLSNYGRWNFVRKILFVLLWLFFAKWSFIEYVNGLFGLYICLVFEFDVHVCFNHVNAVVTYICMVLIWEFHCVWKLFWSIKRKVILTPLTVHFTFCACTLPLLRLGAEHMLIVSTRRTGEFHMMFWLEAVFGVLHRFICHFSLVNKNLMITVAGFRKEGKKNAWNEPWSRSYRKWWLR
jgi:hypothetical protein